MTDAYEIRLCATCLHSTKHHDYEHIPGCCVPRCSCDEFVEAEEEAS